VKRTGSFAGAKAPLSEGLIWAATRSRASGSFLLFQHGGTPKDYLVLRVVFVLFIPLQAGKFGGMMLIPVWTLFFELKVWKPGCK